MTAHEIGFGRLLSELAALRRRAEQSEALALTLQAQRDQAEADNAAATREVIRLHSLFIMMRDSGHELPGSILDEIFAWEEPSEEASVKYNKR